MALLDDIVGMILVVLFFIVGAMFISTQIATDQITRVDSELQNQLYDYYSTSTNTFLNKHESQSGLPVNLIIGDYISKGRDEIPGEEGDVLVNETLEGILDDLYDEGNYHMEIQQAFHNTTISFVFDGSDSNSREREVLDQNIRDIKESVSDIFEDEGATLEAEFYILSEDQDVCDEVDYEDCEVIDGETLYDKDSVFYELERPFDDLSGKAAEERIYVESDWLGGMLHVERNFRKELDEETGQEIHIILPVFDQLSTGSVPDTCFEEESHANHIACRLCHYEENNKCSLDRINESVDIEEAEEFFMERGGDSIVIPVFSFQCNQRYIDLYNEISDLTSGIYSNYLTGDAEFGGETETECAFDDCAACREAREDERINPQGGYRNVCFRTDCHEKVTELAGRFAEPTGGDLVDITNVDGLANSIKDNIEVAFDRRMITIGEEREGVETYVFENNVILPNLGHAEIRLSIYNIPDHI